MNRNLPKPAPLLRRLPLLLLPLALFAACSVLAQAPGAASAAAPPAVEMADSLRADGKIWVVAGVFAIVMLGMLVYLLRLESKVGKLEKRMRNEE